MSDFLARLRFGQAVICNTCGESDTVLLKSKARKFYAKHGSKHRHPAGTAN